MISWQNIKTDSLVQLDHNLYALRIAKTVSDLDPSTVKLYSDNLVTLNGHYNQRGYCVGYSLLSSGKPAVLLSDFYLVLDYVTKNESPGKPSYPKLGTAKDSKISFVRFGDVGTKKLYSLIYRKKRDV